MEFTIERLELLATELKADETAQHERLTRLCHAYGRILRARETHLFQRLACHHGDTAGHYDTSYPPKQVYSEHTGPRAMLLLERQTEDVATGEGFYFSWRRVTTYGGLYFGADGSWYRSDESGTGRVGQFAAHPGDCGVACTIEWAPVDDADLTLDELRDAEVTLRKLAFPLATAKSA